MSYQSKKNELPDWELVISAASHLQEILPEAVLVGGTATAVHAEHRFSRDADHVITDLVENFDKVLSDLESVAGWKTARVKRPVLILGSLDGIETGIRQLIRSEPLETMVVERFNQSIRIPTEAEMLRIKAVLILKRNATRDYLDFIAMTRYLGHELTMEALKPFDELYHQENGESPLQQLQTQLSKPLPFDLDEIELSSYKGLNKELQEWNNIEQECSGLSNEIFEQLLINKLQSQGK